MAEDSTTDLVGLVDEMTRSMSTTREVIGKIRSQRANMSTKDGISLLSLKHHVMLSYMHSLVLSCAHRALGNSLSDHQPPPEPFSSLEQSARGHAAGDLVDSMVEGRVVLEKVKMLEGRMRYQIDKLVKLAQEPEASTSKSVMDDPLAFRPNPANLAANSDDDSEVEDDEPRRRPQAADRDFDDEDDEQGKLYRPPRLAAVPYTERNSKKRPPPRSQTLSALANVDSSAPHRESVSGLSAPITSSGLQSSRAKELARMTEYEEENFNRLVMKKSEAKRRIRDEADLALGGGGRHGGLDTEFDDVLRSVTRKTRTDPYEMLRQRGKRESLLERSRKVKDQIQLNVHDDERPAKKGRFEKEASKLRRRSSQTRQKK